MLTARTYAGAVADALSATGLPPKRVAHRADVPPRTAEGWMNGTNGPSGAHFVRLAAEFDEVFDAFMQMTGRISAASYTAAEREQLKRAMTKALAILGE